MKLLKRWQSCPIAFGGASLSGQGGGYGFGSLKDCGPEELLRLAFEKGIRVFDSAPIYGFGDSEKVLGKVFKNNRESIRLVSKSGVSWHQNRRVNMTNCPLEAGHMLEASLKRFDTEYIDLYMIHWPDQNVDIRKPMEVLAKAKAEGKIHHIGLCNTSPEDFSKASEIDKVEVIQSELNLFNMTDFNKIKHLLEETSFMGWGTLDKGILAGSVHKDRIYEKTDARSWAPWWKKSNKDEKIDLFQNKILPLLNESNVSPVEFALNYNLSRKEVDVVLMGFNSIEKINMAFDSLEKEVCPKLIVKIEDLVNRELH